MRELTILVLEDYFALQRQLVNFIESMNHKAIGVGTAPTAMAILTNVHVDAMILDCFIKEGDKFAKEGGFSLITRVRRKLTQDIRCDPKTPIMVISGGVEIPGGYSPLRTARDLGADVCMKKPVDLQEIAAWVSEIEADLVHPN